VERKKSVGGIGIRFDGFVKSPKEISVAKIAKIIL
jgi:hypothetical protein